MCCWEAKEFVLPADISIMIGFAMIVLGILALVLGGTQTKAAMNRHGGTVVAGTGQVPSWVSLIVLSGWVLIPAGVVALFVV